eukprot:PhM_4_TR2693/c0_g1_i1/m.63746
MSSLSLSQRRRRSTPHIKTNYLSSTETTSFGLLRHTKTVTIPFPNNSINDAALEPLWFLSNRSRVRSLLAMFFSGEFVLIPFDSLRDVIALFAATKCSLCGGGRRRQPALIGLQRGKLAPLSCAMCFQSGICFDRSADVGAALQYNDHNKYSNDLFGIQLAAWTSDDTFPCTDRFRLTLLNTSRTLVVLVLKGRRCVEVGVQCLREHSEMTPTFASLSTLRLIGVTDITKSTTRPAAKQNKKEHPFLNGFVSQSRSAIRSRIAAAQSEERRRHAEKATRQAERRVPTHVKQARAREAMLSTMTTLPSESVRSLILFPSSLTSLRDVVFENICFSVSTKSEQGGSADGPSRDGTLTEPPQVFFSDCVFPSQMVGIVQSMATVALRRCEFDSTAIKETPHYFARSYCFRRHIMMADVCLSPSLSVCCGDLARLQELTLSNVPFSSVVELQQYLFSSRNEFLLGLKTLCLVDCPPTLMLREIAQHLSRCCFPALSTLVVVMLVERSNDRADNEDNDNDSHYPLLAGLSHIKLKNIASRLDISMITNHALICPLLTHCVLDTMIFASLETDFLALLQAVANSSTLTHFNLENASFRQKTKRFDPTTTTTTTTKTTSGVMLRREEPRGCPNQIKTKSIILSFSQDEFGQLWASDLVLHDSGLAACVAELHLSADALSGKVHVLTRRTFPQLSTIIVDDETCTPQSWRHGTMLHRLLKDEINEHRKKNGWLHVEYCSQR